MADEAACTFGGSRVRAQIPHGRGRRASRCAAAGIQTALCAFLLGLITAKKVCEQR